MQRYHVYLTLAEDEEILAAVLGKIKREQIFSLVICRRIVRVYIFSSVGRLRFHRSCAERYDVARHIDHGESDPVLENIVIAAVAEERVLKLLRTVSEIRQIRKQLSAGRAVPEPEMLCRLVKSAFPDILRRLRIFSGEELS